MQGDLSSQEDRQPLRVIIGMVLGIFVAAVIGGILVARWLLSGPIILW